MKRLFNYIKGLLKVIRKTNEVCRLQEELITVLMPSDSDFDSKSLQGLIDAPIQNLKMGEMFHLVSNAISAKEHIQIVNDNIRIINNELIKYTIIQVNNGQIENVTRI